ncbi:hypothetical protein HPB48_017819 [Haemaphysalis longicornis]|uniref:Major facilitator superfamily (MFS) profile domain-containing protein n=1 Tax=Haemaphysalis longicornis TaxID=44386 RepID=A0A9J6GCB4_HAELO|nr:hypothetical protein HPB48_017819 [Haemaphysalis longicornis]
MQVACSEWDYDPELAHNTLVSHWNLVCSRRPLVAVADAVYSAGALAAMGVASCLAESAGRKPAIILGVAMLLLGTLGITFADTYILYISTRFLNSACATTVFVASQTLLFEVSTDGRRAPDVALAFAFGDIAAEFWFDVLQQLRLTWQQLQATILSPTLLSMSAFLVVYESPRWLICQRQMWEAEALMLAAARKNGFSWSEAVISTGRIKDEVTKRRLLQEKDLDGAEPSDIRRHAVVMSVTYFSATFAYYATLQSVVARKEAWVGASASGASALWFMFLVRAIDRLPRLLLLTSLFTVQAVLGSLMSVAMGVPALHAALFIVTRGCSKVTLLTNMILILELFPTPVRCQAQCLTFACGRVAAVLASLLQVLSYAGREDVVLAVMASLAFASVLLLRFIAMPRKSPLASEVNSKLSSHRSSSAFNNLDAMKETLEPIVYGKKTKKMRRMERVPSTKGSADQRSPSNQPHVSDMSSLETTRNVRTPRPGMSPRRTPGASTQMSPVMRSPRAWD